MIANKCKMETVIVVDTANIVNSGCLMNGSPIRLYWGLVHMYSAWVCWVSRWGMTLGVFGMVNRMMILMVWLGLLGVIDRIEF